MKSNPKTKVSPKKVDRPVPSKIRKVSRRSAGLISGCFIRRVGSRGAEEEDQERICESLVELP